MVLGEEIDAEAGFSDPEERYAESGGRSASEGDAPGEQFRSREDALVMLLPATERPTEEARELFLRLAEDAEERDP